MIQIAAAFGLALSLYAFYVTRKTGRRGYKPWCDISRSISCTRAFTHSAGKTLGVHNSVLGIVYYLLVLMFPHGSVVFLILTALALGRSLQLAYVSYVKMRNFCVVCTMSYVVNATLFLLGLVRPG